jgi:hypothetical protein
LQPVCCMPHVGDSIRNFAWDLSFFSFLFFSFLKKDFSLFANEGEREGEEQLHSTIHAVFTEKNERDRLAL